LFLKNIVLKSKSNQNIFQAFEFISPHKRINNDIDNTTKYEYEYKSSDESVNYDPLVLVSYAISSSMKKAKLLLRDEEVTVIDCSDVVMLELARLFDSSFAKSGLIDFTSGLTVKEGYLEPIYPSLPMFKGRAQSVEKKEEEVYDYYEEEVVEEGEEEEDLFQEHYLEDSIYSSNIYLKKDEEKEEEDDEYLDVNTFQDFDCDYQTISQCQGTKSSKKLIQSKLSMVVMTIMMVIIMSLLIIGFFWSETSTINPFLVQKFSIPGMNVATKTIHKCLSYLHNHVPNIIINEESNFVFLSKEKFQMVLQKFSIPGMDAVHQFINTVLSYLHGQFQNVMTNERLNVDFLSKDKIQLTLSYLRTFASYQLGNIFMQR
jgi:hypothetical protein